MRQGKRRGERRRFRRGITARQPAFLIHHLVQRHHHAVVGVQQQAAVVLQLKPHGGGDLGLLGRIAQALLKLLDHALKLATGPPHTARQPVTRAQLIEHRATDALTGIGGKAGAVALLIAAHAFTQPQHASLNQILEIDTRWQAHLQLQCDPAYQRLILGVDILLGHAPIGGIHRRPGPRLHPSGSVDSGSCPHPRDSCSQRIVSPPPQTIRSNSYPQRRLSCLTSPLRLGETEMKTHRKRQ